MFDSQEQKHDLKNLWETWTEKGEPELSCSGCPDLFFPEKGEPAVEVRALCKGCPIIQECGLFALKWDEPGIWGGMTGLDRRILKQNLARAKRAA